jgi:hypothetical protein
MSLTGRILKPKYNSQYEYSSDQKDHALICNITGRLLISAFEMLIAHLHMRESILNIHINPINKRALMYDQVV